VSSCQWWWVRAIANGATTEPAVLQLDVDNDRIVEADDPRDCVPPFDPDDWGSEWAPCLPPETPTLEQRVAAVLKEAHRHLFGMRAAMTWDSQIGDDIDRLLGLTSDVPDAEWCLAKLTALVDQTAPSDPIGAALTRSGLVGPALQR